MSKVVSFIERCRQFAALQVFTIYLRYLIGGTFIIAAIGMGKLSGKSFIDTATPIGDLMPMQQFFRVMADSGLYWKFIGWFQVGCGVLLMTQRFARLGALMFFGMIVNIFVITISYGFQGTPIVTGLLSLAAAYLLIWDINALQFIIRKPIGSNLSETKHLRIHDQSYWAMLGVVMVLSIFTVAVVNYNVFYALASPFAIGLVGFIVFFLPFKKQIKTPA